MTFRTVQSLNQRLEVWALVIALLTRVRLEHSSALQSRKWQLIGVNYNGILQRIIRPSIAPDKAQTPLVRLVVDLVKQVEFELNGQIGPPVQLADKPPSKSTTSGLRPVPHYPTGKLFYSFPIPLRVGG